jgi:hypothetical protein
VIGAHSPEFPFEHDVEKVKPALEGMGVEYPIAMDNDFAIWSAFGSEAWPALYFVDAQGRFRHRHLGEDDYERSERVIQQPLADAETMSAIGIWSRSNPAAWSSRPSGTRSAHRSAMPTPWRWRGEGVPLNMMRRQLGHRNLGVTSTYLQGIDNAEIINTVHDRGAPMMPATAGLML